MNPLRIIIVDDEKRIRTSLKNVIRLYCPNTIIVAEAEDVSVAIESIKINNPDVVLLDIKMPGGTGIDLLKKLIPVSFKIIFITAFDQYAIQAFKFSAIDYLLKPVIPQELIDALARAEQQINKEAENSRLNTFISNMSGIPTQTKKIVLNSHEKMHVLNLVEIVRCEADRNYTRFFLTDKKTIFVSRPLKDYEEILIPYGFFRPHHAHLVNLLLVDRLEKRDGGTLIMKDGSEVFVSSRKYSDLVAALKNI